MIESVLHLAAVKLGHPILSTVEAVKERVFAIIAMKRTLIVSNLAQREIEGKLRHMGKLNGDAAAFTTAYNNVFESVNPNNIYDYWHSIIEKLLLEKDYELALRYYKIKGLAAEAATPVYGGKFQEQIMRWMRGVESKDFVAAMLSVIPRLNQFKAPTNS